MYDMMDAEYVFSSIYFILIVFIMNFWLMNLFVAVINEMFAKVRQESKRSAFTTTRYDDFFFTWHTVLLILEKYNSCID